VAHEVDPGVPLPLSHIIQRLLEKDPANRYQSADKIVEHLKTLGVSEKPGSLRPQSSLDLAELRSAPSEPLPSSAQSGAAWPTSPPTPRPRTPSPEPTPRPQHTPTPAEATEPRPKRRLSLLFAGLAAVLLLALGTTLYLALRSEPEPAPAPPPRQPIAELIQTSTGEMLLIPAGEFTFGADPDISLPIIKPEGFEAPNPRQTVELGDFYMDVTEVSNAAYKQFCDLTGRPYPAPPADDPTYFEAKLDYPVINVSFADATAFAEWAGKRLPTEQEWEKAARGVDGRIYPWGNSPPRTQVNADGDQDGFGGLAPVNALPAGASPYGLLNMSGNVWEWTASAYRPSPEEIADREMAWGNAWRPGAPWFVIKGGSYFTPSDDLDLLLFFRAANPADIKIPFQGFRCAMDPPQR
jgi:formylglycine-generating enzyme required for sulfatase activity